MITHVLNSTTKIRVEKFAVQSLHIGQQLPFPLLLINIAEEKTEDVAMHVNFAFETLVAIRKKWLSKSTNKLMPT